MVFRITWDLAISMVCIGIMNNLSMNYNLQQTENSLFSATFRLRSNSQPHWDYQGVLTNVADSDDKVDMIDRTKESWSRPSLDLYYQQGGKNHAVCIKKACRMSC